MQDVLFVVAVAGWLFAAMYHVLFVRAVRGWEETLAVWKESINRKAAGIVPPQGGSGIAPPGAGQCHPTCPKCKAGTGAERVG